jgi:shikimate kinase
VLACALRPSTNVVLFGPRGAGKTTVGRLVARRLGRPFVDTDAEIAGREGRPAGEVLALRGEAAFRRIEEDVVGRALARRGVVVAVGGGAPTRDANVRRIAARSFAVRLAVRPEEAARRIAADPTIRPRLTGARDLLEECERIAREREGAYAALARATVETEGRDPTEVAEEVAVLSAAVFARGPGDGVVQRYEEGGEGRR